MRSRYLLALALFLNVSCYSADKRQAIAEFINTGKPEQAIAILSLDECESDVDACGTLGVGLFQFEQYIDLGKQYLNRAAAAGQPQARSYSATS